MRHKKLLFVCAFALFAWMCAFTAQNAAADDRSKLIEKMIKQLTKDKKADQRAEAAKTLGGLGAVEAVPVLGNALKDPEEDVRWEAAYALFQISPKATEAIPQLREALKDSSGHVRLNAVAALSKMKVPDQELIPSVRDLLKDRDSMMRINAAGALLSMDVPAKEVLPVLLDGLKDPNPDVRKEAAKSLDDAGELPKEALPALIDGLKNANPAVREAVVKAIGKMGMTAEQAAPALAAALKDVNDSVKRNAIDALGGIGPGAKTAIPALAEIIERDPDAYTRKSAVRALSKIDVENPAALPAFLKALKDQDADVRTEALDEAFRQMQPLPASAVAALKETAANDSSEINRRHADGILKDSQHPGAVPVAKLTVTPRSQIQPLLDQLNRELGDKPEPMPDQAAAKQYLHDRDITFNKDYFWSNLTEGYLDVVEAFLKLGMSPNTLASGRSDTPLMFTTMYCSEAGEAQMSLLLLIYGADPNVKDDINRSAIHAAAEHCPAVVVKALLMAGARTGDVTNGGSTVLASAVGSNNPEIVRMILNSGYKIKNEPSYLLSSAKNAEIKQMLIKAGVKK